MRVIERRFDVELTSREVLKQFMAYAGASANRSMTIKELADACTAKGVPTSKATIGHLLSGHTKRTSTERAKAIAEVLGAPRAVLFVPKVSTVQRDVPPGKRVA